MGLAKGIDPVRHGVEAFRRMENDDCLLAVSGCGYSEIPAFRGVP
mgnify:CR=1 FL=1